nr:thiamine phosphate synthase [Macrococcus goetzii]
MITPPKPTTQLLQQIIEVQHEIDGVILRFDASDDEIIRFINILCTQVDKDKLIVHNNPDVLLKCGLQRIHFKEQNTLIKDFVSTFPNIQVSQSVHSIESVKQAALLNLAFVLFGHVFPTPSKPNIAPQDPALVNRVLQCDIPVVALGGIDLSTIHDLNPAFDGFAGIRLFMNTQAFLAVKKEWLLRTIS